MGLGATSTIVNAQQNYRTFDIANGSGAAGFESLTVTGGRTTADNQRVGGIQLGNGSSLSLVNSIVSDNSTSGSELTLVNGLGQRSAGTIVNNTDITAPGFGATAHLHL